MTLHWSPESRSARFSHSAVANAALPGIPSPRMSLYRRVLASFRPDLGPTVLAMVLTLGVNGFNLPRPWPLKSLVDEVLPAASRTPHGLKLAGIDLGAWSIPAIIAIVCSL